MLKGHILGANLGSLKGYSTKVKETLVNNISKGGDD